MTDEPAPAFDAWGTDALFEYLRSMIDAGTTIDLTYPNVDGQCFVMVDHEAFGGLCYFGATPRDALLDAANGVAARQRRYGRLPHQRNQQYTFGGVRVSDEPTAS